MIDMTQTEQMAGALRRLLSIVPGLRKMREIK
jgi:hypothetical protein